MNASTVKADTLEPRHVYKKKSQIREVWERYKRDKLAMFGLILFVIMCVAALSTNFFVDYDGDVITMHLNEKFWGPSADHWLGTDLFGAISSAVFCGELESPCLSAWRLC